MKLAIESITIEENTRKVSPKDDDLKDLVESIKDMGVRQPLEVKKQGEVYQLVTGHRRLVAASIAGLSEVPVTVITDKDILKVQITENLMRKDLTVFEEARSFKHYLDEGKTPADISGIIHKSEKYVLQRLTILDLPKQCEKLYNNNKIEVPALFELARLPKAIQKNVLESAIDTMENYEHPRIYRELLIQEVEGTIKINWRTDDNYKPMPCKDCEFCSDNKPVLFDDMKNDPICFNPDEECWTNKGFQHLGATIDAMDPDGTMPLFLEGYTRAEKLKEIFPGRQILSYWDYQPSKAKKAIEGIKLSSNWEEKEKVRLVEKKSTSDKVKTGKAPKLKKTEGDPDGKLKRRIEIARNKLYREEYNHQLALYANSREFIPKRPDSNITVKTRKVLKFIAENMFVHGKPSSTRLASLILAIPEQKLKDEWDYEKVENVAKKYLENDEVDILWFMLLSVFVATECSDLDWFVQRKTKDILDLLEVGGRRVMDRMEKSTDEKIRKMKNNFEAKHGRKPKLK